jgi:hypothetical protein
MDSQISQTMPEATKKPKNKFLKPAIIAGVVTASVVGGVLAAPFLVPAALGTVGFSSTGVVGGSIAAGSAFAACQSMAMGGAIVPAATAATGAATGTAGGLLGFMGTLFIRKKKNVEEKSNTEDTDNTVNTEQNNECAEQDFHIKKRRHTC